MTHMPDQTCETCDERFLSTGKIAKIIGVESTPTVRRLIETGEIKGGRRIGRWWRATAKAAREYVARRSHPDNHIPIT